MYIHRVPKLVYSVIKQKFIYLILFSFNRRDNRFLKNWYYPITYYFLNEPDKTKLLQKLY